MMDNQFSILEAELSSINLLASQPGVNGFFGQEMLRFYSIAGSIIQTFDLNNSSIDERYMTHILSRSLLENFFWLLYIYDDSAKTDSRYEELLNSFKIEYLKLLNDKLLPNKDKLEPADSSWSSLPKGLNVNSMLAQIKNNYGDRLDYLYFLYRVTSFDTHGKNLNVIFSSVFDKECNFPFLDLNYGFNLIANEYMLIMRSLQRAGKT